MSVSATIKVEGVKDAIKELGRISPELRKQFNRDAQGIMAPVVLDAKSRYPDLPLSGMARAWRDASGRQILPWDIAKVRRGLRLKIDTSRKNLNVIYLQQNDRAGAAFESAGRASQDAFARALGPLRNFDTRVMGPALSRRANSVEDGIQRIVRDVMRRTGRRIG